MILRRPWVCLALTSIIAPLSGFAGQSTAPKADDSQVSDAIKRVEKNDLGSGPVDALSFVDLIAAARAPQGLPVLEQYFSRTSDPQIKAGVASALVRMGDKDDSYWNFLVTLSTPVLENDAPLPFDEPTAAVGAMYFSTEFEAWAEAHELSVQAAYKLAWQDLPLQLAPLAQTGDPRGIPLLRKALTSPNLMIAALGAEGLAQAKDVASVPLIIDACKKQPAFLAHFLADSLRYFDDPRALKAFMFYFPDMDIDQVKKFNGQSAFGPLKLDQ